MIKKQGRPNVYHSLTYKELGDYVGTKAIVPVKKSWLEALGFNFDEPTPDVAVEKKEESTPIEYKITDFE
jgi:hypothetical protein